MHLLRHLAHDGGLAAAIAIWVPVFTAIALAMGVAMTPARKTEEESEYAKTRRYLAQKRDEAIGRK